MYFEHCLSKSITYIGCFSHNLDHVGEHTKIPVLEEFLKGWIGLFSRSPKARLAWNSHTGVSVPSYSDTRWWFKATYFHEGDGPLIFRVYEEIALLSAGILNQHYPRI